MAQIYKNQVVLGDGIHYTGPKPLDDRTVVESYSDLANLDSSNCSYEGMPVYVKDLQKTYTKKSSGWVEESGGSDRSLTVRLLNPQYTESLSTTGRRVFTLATGSFDGQKLDVRLNDKFYTVQFPSGSSRGWYDLEIFSTDTGNNTFSLFYDTVGSGSTEYHELKLNQMFDISNSSPMTVSRIDVYMLSSRPVSIFRESALSIITGNRLATLTKCYNSTKNYFVFGTVIANNSTDQAYYAFSGFLPGDFTTTLFPLNGGYTVGFTAETGGTIGVETNAHFQDGTIKVWFIEIQNNTIGD